MTIRFGLAAGMSLLLLAGSLRAQAAPADSARNSAVRPMAIDTSTAAGRAAIHALAQRQVDSIVAAALLTSRGADNDDRRAQRKTIMIVLPLMMAVVLVMLFTDLMRQRDVAIESHWGGFGGGAVGTRFSRPLVLMLLLVLLSGMLTAVALVWYATPETGTLVARRVSASDSAAGVQASLAGGSRAATGALPASAGK